MRVYQAAIDYQNVKAWGILNGWSRELIALKQSVAYKINAPFDTVDVENYKVTLFRDLQPHQKKEFWDVKENYFSVQKSV